MTATKPNENYTHFCLLLDRSLSMDRTKQNTIDAVNNFITEQRALPGKASFQLIQFDDRFEAWKPTNLKKTPFLTDENYQPRGNTPLYYSLWRAVEETGAWLRKKSEGKRPAKVIFVVMTDGEHNTNLSKNGTHEWPHVTQEEVASIVKQQQEKYSWSFVYLGANQNAFLVADTIGIRRTATLTYAQNASGIRAASASLGRSVANYRIGAAEETCFAVGDYQKQEEAGVDPSLVTPDGAGSVGNKTPQGLTIPVVKRDTTKSSNS